MTMGGDRRSTPAEEAADEVVEAGSGAGESGSGRSAARDQWSAWERSESGRPGAQPASDEDAPHDRAAAGAQAGTPAPARPDEVPDHPGPAEAKQEADVGEGEVGEEEEAAPSPWSIPLALAGDLSEFDEAEDRQPTGPDSLADDGRTDAAAAAGTRRAPETAGFDVWSRAPGPGSTERTQTGPPETDTGSGHEEPEEAAQAPQAAQAGGDGDADGDAVAAKASGDLSAGRDGGEVGTGGDTRASRTEGDADDGAAAGRAGGDSTARGDGGAASHTGGDTAADADAGDGAEADADDDAGTDSRAATGATAAAGSVLGTAPKAKEAAPPAGTQNDHERTGRSQTPEGNVVVIVPGIDRYHRSACILIRFLGADDLETSTAGEAEANGCVPCRACEPQKPLSDGT
jgi:hypothetical protein